MPALILDVRNRYIKLLVGIITIDSKVKPKVYALSLFHRGECTALQCRLYQISDQQRRLNSGDVFLFPIIIKIVEDVVLIVWDGGFILGGDK